ncbi:putative RNA-binding protein with RPS1 domain [Virgibacillus natechei]|uniref:RNA-binding protein with RPS1 domain n=1 Tax=Virgibacillus natechei TaxID=1216297 RepID=A0ABS4IKY8_9BACI|nr:host-nuclease inhibitor Gam family protein [Virgibacillus natechei]MBP1971627.1 putative RNA-binding protein with RPS1 domain [Virgibacillus natechei]UZD13046.1 host-nuclease inhibitor Gam family protein [Virgibacillus natechei]
MTNLNDYLDEQEQVENEAFTIKDDNAANWALRKIKQHQQQKEANNKLAVEEIEKLEAWNKSENDKAQQSIDYFQGLLSYYALSKREADPKWKSQKLPNGRIRFKKQQPKYVYNDESLMMSLKALGRHDLITVKETPSKSDVKKSFVEQNGRLIDTETGALLDGVTVVDQEEKFEVATDD